MKNKRSKFSVVLSFAMVIVLVAMVAVSCGQVAVQPQKPNDPQGPDPEKYCVVEFYANDASAAPPRQVVERGNKVTPPTGVVKTDYELLGWYTSKNFAVEWNFNTDIADASYLTLYAKWKYVGTGTEPPEITNCAVTFVTNCNATVSPQLVRLGEKATRPAALVKDGYTFGGWYSDSAFTSVWNFDTAVSAATLTLYAKWDRNAAKCTVNFVTNCDTSVAAQSVTVGDRVVRPSGLSRSGYALVGWYTDSNFAPASQWNFNTAVAGSEMTLYAKWTLVGDNPVTVTFNVGRDARQAGLSNPPAKVVASGNVVAQPEGLVRDGYTISGWYSEDGDTQWDFASDRVTDNMTLFAQWVRGGNSGGTVIDYTPTHTADNKLYLHYLRSAGDYPDDNNYEKWYYAYVWIDGIAAKNYYMIATDVSGAVIEIDLNYFNNSARIKYIITKPGWVKDGGDCEVALADTLRVGNSYHWFIKQGATNAGAKYLTSFGEQSEMPVPEIRESRSNVNRSYAQQLPKMPTADGWDDVGLGYQIFVASFCDSNNDGVGDIRGIINKLEYLQELNVDVLWLTPVQSSNSYHGYDCYDYYSIDQKFGTNADYRELVYKAHQRGMKIVMDLVVNHTSQQNEWFIKSRAGVTEKVTYQDGTTATINYRDFYRWSRTDKGRGRWNRDGDYYFYSSFGSNMPELNYDYQPVRDAMADVAAYWMNYGLDGFRMDAIKHLFMWDESENETGDIEGGANDKPYNYNRTKNVEFFREFNHKLKSKYPSCFLLGEQLSGNVDETSAFLAGMDSVFDFNTYYDLPDRIADGEAQAAANAFNTNAQKCETERGARPINGMISSNHDIPRMSAINKNDLAQMKLYMAIVLTMPGLPWIYYGDEIGLIGDDGNGGDKRFRQSMRWTENWANECHNDISQKDLNADTKSVAAQQADQNSLWNYVKSLTTLRAQNPAMVNGTATCSAEDGMLKISIVGKDNTTRLTVYHNFSAQEKSVAGTSLFGGNTVKAYGTAVVRAA